jgi:hypothetical protein
MRRIAFAVGFTACLAFVQGAWGQDSPPSKPAPQIRPSMPQAPPLPAVKKPKPAAAATTDAAGDPIEAVDQREEELLAEKLKSICRGC